MPSIFSLGPDEIRRILPQRAPFLFIERFDVIEKASGVGHWPVPEAADFFEGHFPGNPIVPGVILCEALAQASGILIGQQAPEGAEHRLHYLAGIDGVRFRRTVHPGETVDLHVAVKRGKWGRPIWQFTGKAMVKDEIAAEAVITVVRS